MYFVFKLTQNFFDSKLPIRLLARCKTDLPNKSFNEFSCCKALISQERQLKGSFCIECEEKKI